MRPPPPLALPTCRVGGATAAAAPRLCVQCWALTLLRPSPHDVTATNEATSSGAATEKEATAGGGRVLHYRGVCARARARVCVRERACGVRWLLSVSCVAGCRCRWTVRGKTHGHGGRRTLRSRAARLPAAGQHTVREIYSMDIDFSFAPRPGARLLGGGRRAGASGAVLRSQISRADRIARPPFTFVRGCPRVRDAPTRAAAAAR